jgi:hypothetical protein
MPSGTALIPEAVVPLLLGAGNTEFLSAQLWPLDLALVVLAREAPEGSEVQRVLARMPQAAASNGQRFTGLRNSIQRLVARGALRPGGEGWDAGYAVQPKIREDGRRMLKALPLPDQAALQSAAQALSEALRMVSKNGAASAPSGSATI